jgi:hypothetical protein
MITLGKRPRPPYSSHYYPSGPGAMPNVPDRASGPSGIPPIGSQLSVQSRSTVKYLQTNPTASIPIMVRPWSDHYEKDYAPGCLIFAKQKETGRSSLITVADVPTLNYLFAEDATKSSRELCPDDFEFFGIFRNDAGKQVDHLGFPRYTNPKQRLIQCDVYGRGKISNFWGDKLRTGQRLGIALVVKKISKVQEPNKYPRALAKSNLFGFQLVPTVNECLPGTTDELNRLPNMANLADGSVDPDRGDLFNSTNKREFVKFWHIGVVSQAAYESPSKANIGLAMHNSQQRTNLPQIEVLMI